MGNNYALRARSRRCRQQAFTLVEIMVVVLIISVIINMALPSLITARDNTQTKACITNLRHIQDAKDEWAIVTRAGNSATPQWSDLAPYLQLNGATQLTCPTQGGPYVIENMSNVPICFQYQTSHAYDGS